MHETPPDDLSEHHNIAGLRAIARRTHRNSGDRSIRSTNSTPIARFTPVLANLVKRRPFAGFAV
jgi:hypothetical protein